MSEIKTQIEGQSGEVIQKEQKLPDGYNKPTNQQVLKSIPEATKEIFQINKETKEDLERFNDIIELKRTIAPQFAKTEGFERGMIFLSNSKNISQQDYDLVKNILIKATINKDVGKRIQDYFDIDGFFSSKDGVKSFLNEFKKECQEVDVKAKEVDKNTKINEALSKINNNPKVKEIFNSLLDSNKPNKLTQEQFKELTPDKQKDIIIKLLSQIQKESVKETNPEKKKELESMFFSVSRDFVSAGIVTDGEVAKLLSESSAILDNADTLKMDNAPGKGFDKFDNGNMYVKFGPKTNEIIVFDEKGKPAEKIASSSSGYEINVDSVPLNRDIAILDNKISTLESSKDTMQKKVDELKTNYIKLQGKPNKTPEEKTQGNQLDTEIKKLNEMVETISKKIVEMKDRLKKYEAEKTQNSSKLENVEKKKEIAKNTIDVLDSLQLTSFFSQGNLDEMLTYLQTDEIEKITGVKLDFSSNAKEATKINLKNIMSKLFGKHKNEVFENGTDKLLPPYDKQDYIRETELIKEPKVIDNGVLKVQGIKERLSKQTN